MPTHTPNSDDGPGHDIGRSGPTLHRRLPTVAIAALTVLVPAALVILLLPNAGRGAWDATVYHEPFVRQLARDWPRFDLSNPLTATTPGAHILLATVARFGPDSTTALRLVNALIGAALAATLAAWLSRRVRPLDALLLALPLACSIYTFQSAAWLLPDDLAWLMVLIILTLCLREPARWRSIALSSALLVALVLTRQVHLWMAAPVWVSAWLGVGRTDTGLFSRPPARLTRTLGAFALTLPAFALVAWFVRLWGGVVPPRFQSDMGGGNPATPAFILVQTAVLCVGFGPWLLPALLRAARDHRPALALSVLIALALALAPATTADASAGRFSGWWALVAKAPVIAGRTSALFVVLAPAGAVVLAGAFLAVPWRARWTLLGALVAFAVAQSATFYSWQRYHEPFLILLLALLSALQPPELRTTPLARFRLPAMALLCLILGVVTALSLGGRPVPPGTLPPPKHTSITDPWADRVEPLAPTPPHTPATPDPG